MQKLNNTNNFPHLSHTESGESTENPAKRVAILLQKSDEQDAIDTFRHIALESATRQMNMIGLGEQEIAQLKNIFTPPKIQSLIQILTSDEGKAKEIPGAHGYFLPPDIYPEIKNEVYLAEMLDPNKTHIGIYLWRIPNAGMLIKTLNHELNHLFMRYAIAMRYRNGKGKDLNFVMQNERFSIILECFGFLSGAETGILTGNFSLHDGLERAEEGSNGDMNDSYTIASVLARRILEIQIYFGKQVGAQHPDFIKYCKKVRYFLHKCIYSESKFEELKNIVQIQNPRFTITNNMLHSMLTWTGV